MHKLDGFEGRIIVDAKIGFCFIDNYRLAFGVDNIFDSYHLAHADGTLGQGNARVGVAPVDYNGRAFALRWASSSLPIAV